MCTWYTECTYFNKCFCKQKGGERKEGAGHDGGRRKSRHSSLFQLFPSTAPIRQRRSFSCNIVGEGGAACSLDITVSSTLYYSDHSKPLEHQIFALKKYSQTKKKTVFASALPLSLDFSLESESNFFLSDFLCLWPSKKQKNKNIWFM